MHGNSDNTFSNDSNEMGATLELCLPSSFDGELTDVK